MIRTVKDSHVEYSLGKQPVGITIGNLSGGMIQLGHVDVKIKRFKNRTQIVLDHLPNDHLRYDIVKYLF